MVVVISVDALITEDLEYWKSIPEMEKIISSSFVAKDVLCVYPTLTYPCHATILTGVNPGRHGVIHNEEFALNKKMRWLGKAGDIKVPTILDVAKQNGLKTAAVSWPVTGGGDIDYLVGEIWPPVGRDGINEYTGVNSEEGNKVFLNNIWSECTFMNKDIDRLTMNCSLEIIERYKPDLILLHLAELDCSRHNNGVLTERHREALDHAATSILKIWNTVKECCNEESYLVILGDHGQKDTYTSFSLLEVLKDKGLCKFNEDGTLKNYSIYAHSTALSALVYTKDIGENEAYKKLQEIRKEYPGTLKEILTKEAVEKKYGLDGEFSFVVEACDGIYIEKEASKPIIKRIKPNSFMAASHGHRPEDGPKPPFIIYGNGIKKETRNDVKLIDEAPTILSLLGLKMANVDGTSLDIWEKRNE